MKKYKLLFASAFGAMSIAGCGRDNSSPSADASSAGPRVIEIVAGDTMKYTVAKIEAKPGERLAVVLTNSGAMPRDVMGHNWILLKAGSDMTAFAAAAIQAKDTDYVPPSLQDEIVAQIPLLGPRKSGEVRFTVPATPGEYPYLCTFPGHFQVGMHGLLVAK